MASEVSFAQCGRARNVVRLTRHVSEQMQRVHYGRDVVAVMKKCEYSSIYLEDESPPPPHRLHCTRTRDRRASSYLSGGGLITQVIERGMK